MNRQQWLAIGRLGLVKLYSGVLSEALEENSKAGGSLGMISPWIVLEAVGMGEDRDGHLFSTLFLAQDPLYVDRIIPQGPSSRGYIV